jgi:DNA-binding MarR family transcriptional regulator
MKDQFKDGGVIVDNAIGFWIHRVYQASRNDMFRGFREAGTSVTPEQWAVLIRLWENDGQTQTALSDSTFRDKPTMSRILDVLERDGLVARRDDPGDGRVRVVTLTRHGRELKRKLVPVAERIVSKMVAGIPDQDLETTRSALKVMFQNLSG